MGGDDSTKTQTQNVGAAKAVGDLIRTCLGPKAMLKMLMDPMGGIVMTNDGNAILREITVQHPAAKMKRLEMGQHLSSFSLLRFWGFLTSFLRRRFTPLSSFKLTDKLWRTLST